MAVTKEDLSEFNRFADEKLRLGSAESIVALAGEWELQQREAQEIFANGTAIQENVDAVSVRKLAIFFPAVQDEQQLREALSRSGGVTTAEMLAKAAKAAVEGTKE